MTEIIDLFTEKPFVITLKLYVPLGRYIVAYGPVKLYTNDKLFPLNSFPEINNCHFVLFFMPDIVIKILYSFNKKYTLIFFGFPFIENSPYEILG